MIPLSRSHVIEASEDPSTRSFVPVHWVGLAEPLVNRIRVVERFRNEEADATGVVHHSFSSSKEVIPADLQAAVLSGACQSKRASCTQLWSELTRTASDS